MGARICRNCHKPASRAICTGCRKVLYMRQSAELQRIRDAKAPWLKAVELRLERELIQS